MTSRVLLILAVLLLTIQCSFAQTDDTASGFPYVGEVNATRVYVRCGPGDQTGHNNYYVCTRLNKPDRVTVVGQRKGWLRILAPKGCFSVIAQQYVQVDPATNVGTLTGNNVWSRPGGTLRTTNFTLGQRRLKKGEKVQVIGTIEEPNQKWYKIKSPEKTYFWIFARFVNKVQDIKETPVEVPDEKPAVTVSKKVTVKPAAKPVAAKAAIKIPAETKTSVEIPKTPSVPVEKAQEAITVENTTTKTLDPDDPLKGAVETDTLQDFRDLQKEMVEEYKKPLSQRDLEGLVEKFKKLPLKEKSPLRPFVNYYISYIQHDIDRKQGQTAAEMLVRSTEEKQQRYDLQRAKAEIQQIEKSKVYTTTGILAKSQLFSGKVTGIKRYLVFDVATRKLNAYIESDATVSLDKYLGKYVGIYGTTRYDKDLGVQIITPTQVIVLKKQAAMPAFPEPIVKHMPKPVIKPKGKLAGKIVTVKDTSPKKVAATQPKPVAKKAKPKTQPKPGVEKKKQPAPKPVKKAAPAKVEEPKPAKAVEVKPEKPAVKKAAPQPTTKPAPKKVEKPAIKLEDIEKKAAAEVKPASKKKTEAPVVVKPQAVKPQAAKKNLPTAEVKPAQSVAPTPADLPAVPEPKVKVIKPAAKATQVKPQVEIKKVTPAKPTIKINEPPVAVEKSKTKIEINEKYISTKTEVPTAKPANIEPKINQPQEIIVPKAEINPDDNSVAIKTAQSKAKVVQAPSGKTPEIKVNSPAVKPRVMAVLKPKPVAVGDISTKAITVKNTTSKKKIATTQPAKKSASTKPADITKIKKAKPTVIEPIIRPLPLERTAPAIGKSETGKDEVIDIPDIEQELEKPIPPAGLPLADEKKDSTVDESEYE